MFKIFKKRNKTTSMDETTLRFIEEQRKFVELQNSTDRSRLFTRRLESCRFTSPHPIFIRVFFFPTDLGDSSVEDVGDRYPSLIHDVWITDEFTISSMVRGEGGLELKGEQKEIREWTWPTLSYINNRTELREALSFSFCSSISLQKTDRLLNTWRLRQ